jgi:hypothetical protein
LVGRLASAFVEILFALALAALGLGCGRTDPLRATEDAGAPHQDASPPDLGGSPPVDAGFEQKDAAPIGDVGDGGALDAIDAIDAVPLDAERLETGVEDAQEIDATPADGRAELVIRTNPAPVDLAVDAVNLYWTDAQSIDQCDKAACAPMTLASTVLASGADTVRVDASSVYWVSLGTFMPNSGFVAKCAIGGCNGSPTLVADGLYVTGVSRVFVGALALDSGRVYYIEDEDHLRVSDLGMPLPNTAVLSSGTYVIGGFAVGGGRVYFGTGPSAPAILSCPSQGPCAAPTVEVADAYPGYLVFRNGTLAWTEYQVGGFALALAQCRAADCANTVQRTAVLPDPIGFPTVLTVDDVRFYFAIATQHQGNFGGGEASIYGISVEDGEVTRYAEHVPFYGHVPLATDDRYIYWSTASPTGLIVPGDIMRIPK